MKLLPIDYAVRNLGRSPIRLVATVGGSMLVALLIVGATAFVQGMRSSLTVSPENRNVILLGTGSEESLERSQISASVPGHVGASIGGIRQTFGEAHLSPEIHMALIINASRDDTRELRAVIRGVTPAAFLVHPQVEITEGRAPRQGHEEIMVGTLAAGKLGLGETDLAIGKTLWFDDRDWTIVGRFSAPGTAMEGEIWMPLTDLQVAAQRDTLSCVIITLDQTTEAADIDAWAKMRLDLELSAISESAYYASLRRFYRPVQMMVWATAGLMALAGLLGGLNTLYAAFSARTREVGMLQSLGYPRRAIFVSILQESVLASVAGSLIACVLAYWLIDGIAVRFSMGIFELSVDSSAILAGILTGICIGVVGSIPPALQCLRLPIPSALKAT